MRAIITKYHGPTASRASRYSAFDGDNRVTIKTDVMLNSDDNHDAAVVALCKKKGWTGTFRRGWLHNNDAVYVFVDENDTRNTLTVT